MSHRAHDRRYRAAVIGHTGSGDYGHRIHLAFSGIERVEMAALADPDAGGRERAAAACGAARSYADYHKMLDGERLDLVCVCPRWTDQREAMVTACLDAGCSIYCEKPFATTLDEADRMLAAADRAGAKIAVAHQGVYLRQTQQIKEQLKRGAIGELIEMRAVGKQDRRGGGEDMLVLGTHLFNTMRYFAGDAAWINAQVTMEGQPLSPEHVREPSEPVGLVAGDRVVSCVAFNNDVMGRFESRRNHPAAGRCYGLELIGTEGRIAFNNTAAAICRDLEMWCPWEHSPQWEPMDLTYESLHEAGNHHAAADLLEAIEADRAPLSSGRDATAALEMIHGTYRSQLEGGRVWLPMRERGHPLAVLVQQAQTDRA